MDRIDKFLNRRKQKHKRTIKLNNEYYEITKEDVKMVRQYKKNVCLDPTLDLYQPYKLNFTKTKQEEPIVPEFKIKRNEEVIKKKNKKFIEKHDIVKPIAEEKNIIRDVWDDEGDDYEQNIVFDVDDQYNGKLKDLKLEKEDLERELRKIYLKQYLPRERKVLKINEILKLSRFDKSIIKNYPHMIAKVYNVIGETILNEDASILVTYNENILYCYEVKNFYKYSITTFEDNIIKVQIHDNHMYILLNSKELYKISKDGKEKVLGNIIDFDFQSARICISDKCILNLDTGSKIKMKKENFKSVKVYGNYIFAASSNTLRVYDMNENKINESSIFSKIVDFKVYENLIFLINDLKRIIIYDFQRNIIVHSMHQDNDLLSLSYNPKHSFLSVATTKEIMVFYINIGSNQYALTNKINGRHTNLKFDKDMSWLYGRLKDKYVLYT